MKSKIALAISIVVAVVAGLGGVKALQIKKMIDNGKAFAQPPESVSTFEVREEKWQSSLPAIGSIRAAQGVIMTPEIPGVAQAIRFESGSAVEKGAELLLMDVTAEQAQLRSIEAQLQLTKISLERAEKLRADNTVSQAELDQAKSAVNQFQANADAIRATIEKKTIRAPFAGVLGLRQVDLGQYIEAGKPIVSLQALSPVFADFSLPQQELARLQTGMVVRVTTDTYPGRQFDGTLTAINPNLDQATRSVPLRATFENAEKLLRPGMFARVQVLLPVEQNVVTIPATSILSAPYGDSVYIVEQGTNQNLVVRQQFIRTGQMRGDFIAVQTGLKAGQKIVSAGLFKLRNGMSVVENNTIAPEPSANPKPSDS
jgi:membrane fusion protein (multidrug efflux system)